MSARGVVELGRVQPDRTDRAGFSLATSIERTDHPHKTPTYGSSSHEIREVTLGSTRQYHNEKHGQNSNDILGLRPDLSSTYWPEPVFVSTPDRLIEHSGTPPPAQLI
jgi:hypothetical protein